MDGSERIDYQGEEEAVVTETVTYNISHPQVIVERMQPEDLIEEEVAQQNGTEAAVVAAAIVTEPAIATTTTATTTTTTPTTLNDIIADAVDGNEDESMVTEEATQAEDAKPVVEAEEPAEAAAEAEEAAGDEEDQPEEEEEAAAPVRKRQEVSLDLNQCRCCTSRDDLRDIFELLNEESGLPISTVIIKLCAGVTITKRDHLPNVICGSCVQKAEAAWSFRGLCEKTDRELRTSLPRAKAKTRKRTDYTLIDYESSSGEDAGGIVDDEDEFKLSDELAEGSEPSDTDKDSDEEKPRKRGRPRKNAAKPPPKATPSPALRTTPAAGTPRGRGRPPKNPRPAVTPVRAPFVYVEAKAEPESGSEDEEGAAARAPKLTKRQCAKCKAILAPRGPHTCKPVTFSCSFCAEKFATHPLYMNHQQLHTNFQNANTCVRCHRQFPSKPELRKHQSGVRCHKALKNNCLTCHRELANASQLAIHLRTKCTPAGKTAAAAGAKASISPKKEVFTPKKEKNLFKFVAPPTSTYWSDSFSD